MEPFEVTIRGLVKNALAKKNVGAAFEFVKLCEDYEILKPEPSQRNGGVLVMPRSWDRDEWLEMLHQYGAPPWPGKRSGLPDGPHLLRKEANDNTPKEEESGKGKTSPRRNGSGSDARERKRMIDEIAHEERTVSIAGRRQKRSTIELVLIALREQAAEGHVRASRAVRNLLEKYGSHGPRRGPFLVVHEAPSPEEWEKEAFEHQAKYRGNSGE